MPTALSLGLGVRRDLVSRLRFVCDLLCDPGNLLQSVNLQQRQGELNMK